MPEYLPRTAREEGRAECVRLAVYNTASFVFAGGEVIYLLALFDGASNMQMAFLYTAIYASGLMTIATPYFFKGRDNAAVWSIFWYLRTFFTIGYFALPFLVSDRHRVIALICTYYAFMFARSIGVTAWLPILKSFSTERERPEFLNSVFSMSTISVIFTTLISYLFLEIQIFPDEANNYYALVLIGVVVGFIAAYRIGKLPAAAYTDSSSLADTGRTFKQMIKSRHHLLIMILTAIQTTTLILLGYTINFFKIVMDLSAANILLLSLIGLIGATACSKSMQIISGRINAWSLLFGGHLILTIGMIFFALGGRIPSNAFWIAIPALMLVYIGRIASFSISQQLQTSSLIDGQAVQCSVIYQLVTAGTAVLILIIIKILDSLPEPTWLWGHHEYSLIFLTCGILCAVVCGLSFVIHYRENRSINLSIISPYNVFMLYRVQRVEADKDSPHHAHVMEGFLRSNSQVSQALIQEYLETSDVRKRYAALRSVVDHPKMEYYPQVLAEATSHDSPLQIEAITALGFLDKSQDKQVLVDMLEDADLQKKAVIVKTLLRLGHPVTVDDVMDLYKEISRHRVHFNIIVGAIHAGRSDILRAVLIYELREPQDHYWTRALFHYVLEVFDRREAMIDIFDEERRVNGKGIELLIDYIDNTFPESLSVPEAELVSACVKKDIDRINQILKDSGGADWMRAFDISSALGLIYLWCQIREQPDIWPED